MPKIGIAAPGQHSSMNLSSNTYYARRAGRQYAHVLTLWMRNDSREGESVRLGGVVLRIRNCRKGFKYFLREKLS